jgi:hypothetical protein
MSSSEKKTSKNLMDWEGLGGELEQRKETRIT